MDSLIKITDRVELILPLDRDYIYRLVTTFRDNCLMKYNDIFPAGFEKDKIDERFGLLKVRSGQINEFRNSILHYFGYDVKSYKPIDCVVELLRNPRTLKRSLSHTWSAWQKLHGEIYFDDLLIVHTIRVKAPKLFELIASQIGNFRLYTGPRTKQKNEKLYEDIEFILKDQNIDTRLYHQLIRFLFPDWQIPTDSHTEKLTDSILSNTPHPQGIAKSEPTDYLYRFTSEESIGEDQKTMREILRYNEEAVSADDLVKMMINDNQHSARIEYFGELIVPDKVLFLTSAYFKTIVKYDYRRFADYELTGSLWRIHLKNPARQCRHREWLEKVLSKYLPISIRYANDIFYFWKYRNASEAESKYVNPDILQLYSNLIRTIFENDPEKFLSALASEPQHIWTLRHLLFGRHDNSTIKNFDKKETFFSGWQPWLVDLIIKTAEKNSKLIAMQIIPLIYDIRMTSVEVDYDEGNETVEGEPKIVDTWKAYFDQEIASLLFGKQLPKVMEVISILSEDDYAKYETGEQAKIELDFAVSHSRTWKENRK